MHAYHTSEHQQMGALHTHLVRSVCAMSLGWPSKHLSTTKNMARPKGASSAWSSRFLSNTAMTQCGSSGYTCESRIWNLQARHRGLFTPDDGDTQGNKGRRACSTSAVSIVGACCVSFGCSSRMVLGGAKCSTCAASRTVPHVHANVCQRMLWSVLQVQAVVASPKGCKSKQHACLLTSSVPRVCQTMRSQGTALACGLRHTRSCWPLCSRHVSQLVRLSPEKTAPGDHLKR